MSGGDSFLANRKDLRDVDVASKWKLLLTKDQINKAVSHCAKEIERVFEGEEFVVVCILKGCVYFFVDLTRNLTIPYSTYFIEASSYHDSQTQSETVELLSVLVPKKFEGKKVILLDELFDSGTTLQLVKEKLMEDLGKSADDIYTCTLFIKQTETPASRPLPDLYGIALPDVWVVGYGLDDAQEKRGWEYLYGVPKAIESIPKTKDDAMFDSEEVYKSCLEMLEKQLEKIN